MFILVRFCELENKVYEWLPVYDEGLSEWQNAEDRINDQKSFKFSGQLINASLSTHSEKLTQISEHEQKYSLHQYMVCVLSHTVIFTFHAAP
jgi:hypothetical protein